MVDMCRGYNRPKANFDEKTLFLFHWTRLLLSVSFLSIADLGYFHLGTISIYFNLFLHFGPHLESNFHCVCQF